MCHCAKENRKTMMMHHDRSLITLTVCLRKMNIDIGYGFHHSALQNNENCFINAWILILINLAKKCGNKSS